MKDSGKILHWAIWIRMLWIFTCIINQMSWKQHSSSLEWQWPTHLDRRQHICALPILSSSSLFSNVMERIFRFSGRNRWPFFWCGSVWPSGACSASSSPGIHRSAETVEIHQITSSTVVCFCEKSWIQLILTLFLSFSALYSSMASCYERMTEVSNKRSDSNVFPMLTLIIYKSYRVRPTGTLRRKPNKPLLGESYKTRLKKKNIWRGIYLNWQFYFNNHSNLHNEIN